MRACLIQFIFDRRRFSFNKLTNRSNKRKMYIFKYYTVHSTNTHTHTTMIRLFKSIEKISNINALEIHTYSYRES